MVRPAGDKWGCGAKHLAVIGVIVGAVLLVCSSLWSWTGGQVGAQASRIGGLERDVTSVQTEIRVQYQSIREDLAEIRTDVKELRTAVSPPRPPVASAAGGASATKTP